MQITNCTLSVIGLAALLSASCSDPIVDSEWTSREEVGGMTNSLKVTGELEGEATVYGFLEVEDESVLFRWTFDLRVEIVSDSRYELELDTRDFCSPDGEVCISEGLAKLDSTLDCRMNGSGDELDCDGDRFLESYDALDFELAR